ncbi:MAG: DNA alkylation repair protein [Planctomycetes bacterium]|nr:DNA alkylation repair protein [Planctomycetota bacterium]
MSAQKAQRPRVGPGRIGAQRRSEIPPAVLAELNAGRLETVNLVEWLAADLESVLRASLRACGAGKLPSDLDAALSRLREATALARIAAAGEALARAFPAGDRSQKVLALLSEHTSDLTRSCAAYALQQGEELRLEERLRRVRRFAADRNMSVRECAWACVRPAYARDLPRALVLLGPWIADGDPTIRRFAVEGTRPRGVWCSHLEELKVNPGLGAHLLEPLRSDGSDYVRRSVGNWLNDAAKSQPVWVRSLCARWARESRTPETAWITKHALRTLEKGSTKPLTRGQRSKRA